MISVVIPTHNRADLIERAVNSVLDQSYKDIEIIVVSDGSSDNTKEIVESLKESDDRIKFIHYTPARGGNFARNTGIKESLGEYVAFLDDDDEWTSDKLDKQMAEFNENPDVGLVYTGITSIYVTENIKYETRPTKMGDLSKEILYRNYIGTTSSVIIKKSILEKTGYFDEMLGAQQDYDLWIRICQISKIGFVEEPCVKYYNYTSTNQISLQTNKYIDSIKYIEDKYSDQFKKLNKKEKKSRYSNNLLSLSTKALRNNEKRLARSLALKALKNKPDLKTMIRYVLSFTNHTTLLRLRSQLH